MTPTELSWLLVFFLVSLSGGAWLVMRYAQFRRRARAAEASCSAAHESEAYVTRALQMFAHELQALALTLRGHTDQLAAERHRNAPAMAVAAAQLSGLADELDHHLIPDRRVRSLSCETIPLAPLVQEAVATMAAAISPGRRNWRLDPNSSTKTALWADRRALRLVLVRVLGEAVRSSGHDDWIEIGWAATPEALVIRVEDEGAGTALPGGATATFDSRGIGLRLSLARKLIQVHGGALEVEALARIGTRVTVTLPIDRVQADTVAGGAISPVQHILA